MCGPGKFFYSGVDRIQRGLDKAPFPPAASDPFPGEGHVWIVGQGLAYLAVVVQFCPRIEMDRHVVARGRQHLRLPNDRFGILMAEKNEGDFGHVGNELPDAASIVYIDKHE